MAMKPKKMAKKKKNGKRAKIWGKTKKLEREGDRPLNTSFILGNFSTSRALKHQFSL